MKENKSLTLKLCSKKKKSSFDFEENEVLFAKIGARVLDLRPDISSESKWCKCSFQAPGPKTMGCFNIFRFYWIHLMILEKKRSCLLKLERGLWTYGKIRLLGPSGPNVVSRLQTPKSSNFFICHNFTAFILFLWRKRCPVCESWSQGSRLMA